VVRREHGRPCGGLLVLVLVHEERLLHHLVLLLLLRRRLLHALLHGWRSIPGPPSGSGSGRSIIRVSGSD
jgi:hypothetical protein